jgi:branched-chain amino acid transport system substrate-binding protein
VFNSAALTKVHSIILIAVIVFASIGMVAIYNFWDDQKPSSETIKIGYISDISIEVSPGWYGLHGVEWAVEQINAEGGILGRLLEIVPEDSDYVTSGGDLTEVQTAIIRLLTFHKVDFIIACLGSDAAVVCQEACAQHEKIILNISTDKACTLQVANNYDRYKYYFAWSMNHTMNTQNVIDSIVTLKEYTGFNKVGLISDSLAEDIEAVATSKDILASYGFDIVYADSIAPGTLDPSSYLAAIEASGAEILVPYFISPIAFSFTEEWYTRQSPMVMWGSNIFLSGYKSWTTAEGKCDYSTSHGDSFDLGYAITNKTLPIREAYIERWGEDPQSTEGWTYELVRFILYDALERAGTTETEEVIEALEETSMETIYYPLFSFTAHHEPLIRQGMTKQIFFQWQNGELVPVYPKKIMEEAGASYMFPDWSGPWDDLD